MGGHLAQDTADFCLGYLVTAHHEGDDRVRQHFFKSRLVNRQFDAHFYPSLTIGLKEPKIHPQTDLLISL